MATFNLELTKKIKNKEFEAEIQCVIDELLLYEKICVEVCLIAIIGALLAFDIIENAMKYLAIICIALIFVLFFGAACGFFIKRKKYEREKEEYIEYIKDKDEIEIQ